MLSVTNLYIKFGGLNNKLPDSKDNMPVKLISKTYYVIFSTYMKYFNYLNSSKYLKYFISKKIHFINDFLKLSITNRYWLSYLIVYILL